MADDLASAIMGTAQRLGIDPVDLGTAISYETGGTFDPWKRGPTTQWGTHRGLIQWGEPQARQYGVRQGMPNAEQMAAVERYLRDRGVKPGMGLMDVYSAINAGRVGLYNRSDARNGGAPGTVADKVNNQMGGHRQKAAALLAGRQFAQAAPQPPAPPQEPQAPPLPPPVVVPGSPQPPQPPAPPTPPGVLAGMTPPPQTGAPMDGEAPFASLAGLFVNQQQQRRTQREAQEADEQARRNALFGGNPFGPFA